MRFLVWGDPIWGFQCWYLVYCFFARDVAVSINTTYKIGYCDKSAHTHYRKKRKVSQQRFHEYYGQDSHNGIDDWQFTLIEQCETQEQLQEREIFWQHRLKKFYPYGLNEKKNIYIKSSLLTFCLLGTQSFNLFNFYFCFCFNFLFLLFLQFFCLNQVADLVLDTLLSLIFLYSNFLMVWSIIFYFRRLFVIFVSLLFFFNVYLYYLFIHHCYSLGAC